MLDDDKGYVRVGGHVGKEPFNGLKPAGRSAYADNRKRFERFFRFAFRWFDFFSFVDLFEGTFFFAIGYSPLYPDSKKNLSLMLLYFLQRGNRYLNA